MVLKRIFKSKEQRKKDKLKTDLKKQISSTGSNRNQAGKKKRLQRELKAVDAPKKEVKKTGGLSSSQANKRKTYGNNQTGGGGSSTTNKKVVKKATMTAKERAQAMAKKRIASGKTIAQVKAENKAKMIAAAKKKNEAFKAKRKKK